MTIIKDFIKVWEYDINDRIQYDRLETFIPKIWQAILTNDGSLTRNINIIDSNNINIHLIKDKNEYLRELRHGNQINSDDSDAQYLGRKVWLIKDKKKVVFAQSSLYNQDSITSSFSATIPIGKTLIASELDVHRKLQSIYLGYSTFLENHFKSDEPLWGRTYQILVNKQASIMINEIFAPNNIQSIPSINQKINV